MRSCELITVLAGAAGAADADVAREVAPRAGRLVLFDSASVPHGVLPTSRERLALVGWFCSHSERG